MDIYYCGFSRFGQVPACHFGTCVTSPVKVKSNVKELTQKSICLSWSNLFLNTVDGIELAVYGRQNNIIAPVVSSLDCLDDDLLTVNLNGGCRKYCAPSFDEYVDVDPGYGDDDDRIQDVAAGDMHSVVLTESGSVNLLTGETPGNRSLRLSPLALPVKIKSVSCGKEHVLMLSQLGDVYSFGLGSRGQLGLGQMTSPKLDIARVIEALQGVSMLAISAGGWHSAAISEFGDIYMWGWNESGQLGFPCKSLREGSDRESEVIGIESIPRLLDLGDVTVNSVSCGSRHTACSTECGKIFTWGWNEYGQLCHGDTVTRDEPTMVEYFTRSRIVFVQCGGWGTVAITDNSVRDSCMMDGAEAVL